MDDLLNADGSMFKAEGVLSRGPSLDQLLGSLGLGRTHSAAAGLSLLTLLFALHMLENNKPV